MSDLGELMRRAAAKPESQPDLLTAFSRGRRERMLRYGALLSSAGMVIVATVALATYAPSAPELISPAPESPALGKIVFSRWSQESGIMTMNADGSDVRQVADGGHYAIDQPAWSPEGTRIAFHGFYGEASNEGGGLFVMEDDGSQLELLQLAGGAPAWSPDGKQIAFYSGNDGSIRVINLDNDRIETVLPQDGYRLDTPDWSPDGRHLAIGGVNLTLIDPNGDRREVIVEESDKTMLLDPQWAPDGNQIAYTEWNDTNANKGTIKIVDARSGNTRELTEGADPTWSPDGSRIAFGRTDGDESHIYSINIDGTDLQQLTSGPYSDHSPDWTATPEASASPTPSESVAPAPPSQLGAETLIVGSIEEMQGSTVVGIALRAIDLETGESRRIDDSEFAPGDAQFALVRTGNGFVFACSSGACALDDNLQGKKRTLGDAWCFAPSATEGRVWLASLDPDSPDTVRAMDSVREVSLDGKVSVDSPLPPERWHCPVGAVNQGVLFQDDEGLVVWDAASREVATRLPGPFPADTHGDLVAWCEQNCRGGLHVTNTESGEDSVIDADDSFQFQETYDGAFSPDGSLLALPVTTDNSQNPSQIALVDVQAKTASLIEGVQIRGPMSWASSGDRLFIVVGEGRIAVYDRISGRLHEVSVDVPNIFILAAR